MTSTDTMPEKTRNSRILYERGMDYFEQGDYHAARKDFREVLNAEGSEDVKQKARSMLKKTGLDVVEILAGVAVFLLLCFLFFYFGLRS